MRYGARSAIFFTSTIVPNLIEVGIDELIPCRRIVVLFPSSSVKDGLLLLLQLILRLTNGPIFFIGPEELEVISGQVHFLDVFKRCDLWQFVYSSVALWPYRLDLALLLLGHRLRLLVLTLGRGVSSETGLGCRWQLWVEPDLGI